MDDQAATLSLSAPLFVSEPALRDGELDASPPPTRLPEDFLSISPREAGAVFEAARVSLFQNTPAGLRVSYYHGDNRTRNSVCLHG